MISLRMKLGTTLISPHPSGRHDGAGVRQIWFTWHLPEKEEEFCQHHLEARGYQAADVGHALSGEPSWNKRFGFSSDWKRNMSINWEPHVPAGGQECHPWKRLCQEHSPDQRGGSNDRKPALHQTQWPWYQHRHAAQRRSDFIPLSSPLLKCGTIFMSSLCFCVFNSSTGPHPMGPPWVHWQPREFEFSNRQVELWDHSVGDLQWRGETAQHAGLFQGSTNKKGIQAFDSLTEKQSIEQKKWDPDGLLVVFSSSKTYISIFW